MKERYKLDMKELEKLFKKSINKNKKDKREFCENFYQTSQWRYF